MPIIQRYSNIKNGGIVFTGNTLGLSKSGNANAPGLLGSIGAFISLDTSLQVNNFPAGTTLDYTKNGSAANLALPADGDVLYAELVWGGLFRSSENNISSLLDNAVEFTTPLGVRSVLPDAATKQNFNITNNGLTVGFYVRTADVTELVKSARGGVYATGKVPALIEAIDARTAETNHAGWTLAVVYEDSSLPLRNLTLWSGGAVVSPSTGDTDVTLTGFVTPDALPITGKLFISAQEGDAVLTGDRMLFGAALSSLSPLSGPNNPERNFFASQINDRNGVSDTSGTFGTRNANAAAGTNTTGCRQGWDVTAADVSAELTTGMTTAAIRFTTDGDLYVPNCLALQIDSKGAQLKAVKSVDKSYAFPDEPFEYTLTITNEGTLRAETVTVHDLFPDGVSLIDGSITINGVPYAGDFPVTFGPLGAGSAATLKFSVKATVLPEENPVSNTAKVDYTFLPFPGHTVSSSSTSNAVTTLILDVKPDVLKSVDKAYAVKGEKLLYTSVVSNRGNVPLSDLVFKDAIPTGTNFVAGSVTVDGTPRPAYDPNAGFPLPDLEKGQSVTVTFQVQID